MRVLPPISSRLPVIARCKGNERQSLYVRVMIRPHHGVSKLGDLAMRKRATNMASFDGTTDLAVTAMCQLRTAFTASSRSPSSRVIRMSSPNKTFRTWNADHGIKFSSNTALPPSSRSMSTPTAPAYENPISDPPSSERVPIKSFTISSSPDPENRSAETTARHSSETPSHATPVTRSDVKEEPFHTPLKFKMSEKLFEEIQKADESKRYWSYALYRGPDGPDHKVKVHYCRSKDASERVAQHFLNNDVLGFDMEWKPDSYRYSGPKQNVSLIQIANDEKIALFHIALFAKDGIDDLVPPTLKKILENPNIIKVGVAIKGDCTRLRKHLHIDSKGVFELSNLYKLAKYSALGEYEKINKKLVPLAGQVEEHLGLPLFKGEVRGSDWSQPLDLEQLAYAASDTYAGLRLFDTMEAKRRELKPTPPRPYLSEENLPIRLAEGVASQAGDEQTEDTEPESAITRGKLVVDDESIEFEPDSGVNSLTVGASMTTKKKKETIKAPEVIQAEEWVFSWKTSRPEGSMKATNASIRAYALWQHQDLAVEEISTLLGIQSVTVANYVADAIKTEKLPSDPERLSKLLTHIPYSVLTKRYRPLMSRTKSTSV